MFELWIATWCVAYSAFGNYCQTPRYQVFTSSQAAVDFLIMRETDEFWLYPVRFPVFETPLPAHRGHGIAEGTAWNNGMCRSLVSRTRTSTVHGNGLHESQRFVRPDPEGRSRSLDHPPLGSQSILFPSIPKRARIIPI